MQIAIVAGGGGTRLWPLSTEEKPKQFVNIVNSQSLLQYTFSLIASRFAEENIWIVTNKKYKDIVLDQLPEFNSDNLILEPERRDSFAAEAGAAAVIASKKGDSEVISFVPCDDYWPNKRSERNYLNALDKLEEIANHFDIALLGVKPTKPSTQFGYIELNVPWIESIGKPTPVISFKEKPIKKVAEEYLESGNYLWHTHSPTFSFKSLLKTLDDDVLLEVLTEIKKIGTLKESLFKKLPRVAIDFQVLERAENVAVLGVDADWEDIGSWDIVEKYISPPDGVNIVEVDAVNNKYFSEIEKQVAFVGVSNILVVENQNKLIVMDTRDIQNIKNVSKHFQ